MRADEQLRNDPKARAAARELVKLRYEQMDEVVDLLNQAMKIADEWYDPDPRGGLGSALSEARSRIWSARDRITSMRRIHSNDAPWLNETYIGNVAAFGGRV